MPPNMNMVQSYGAQQPPNQPNQNRDQSLIAQNDLRAQPLQRPNKVKKTDDNQSIPQNNNAEMSDFSMRVYWVTPIAKSLREAMSEVNFSEKQQQQISTAFEKCLE